MFPNYTWKVNADKKEIFLTFDDGPIPEVTPWVLKTLEKFNAKASFFCVGDNVRKHPEIYQQLIDRNHTIGNHTFNHLNGWMTDNISYFHNIRKCATVVKSDLFRPPYGKLKPKQTQFLSRHYKIVMWDVLSGDFDPKISADECYQKVINSAKEGSIIVFHDSLKAFDKLKTVLPKVLDYFTELGFTFKALSESHLYSNNLQSA
jgi:peptidoglycan/xylan/chitin deacetylase (PgdA/CDA1 family)